MATSSGGRNSASCSAAALVLAVLASGCTALRGAYTVLVDSRTPVAVAILGRVERFDAVYLRYFPEAIRLRPGDSVRFRLRSTGEPHTVTLGTLVNDVVAAAEKLGEGAPPGEIENLPEMRKLPSFFNWRTPVTPPDIDRSAAEPCFLDAGDSPVSDEGLSQPCPKRKQPKFSGRESFYSSGWLRPAEVFTIELANDIRPGRYDFLSLAHRAVMRGRIDVVGANQSRPDYGQVKEQVEGRRGSREGGEEIRAARSLVGAANLALAATAERAVAGVPASDELGDFLATFGPQEYRIKVGKTVRWSLFGFHSISFDAPPRATEGILRESGSRVVLNRQAWLPEPSASGLGGSGSTSGISSQPIAIDAGAWDGRGFRSSGVLRSFPPATITYALTFTKRGIYKYRCLVHPDMDGKVVVE